MLRREGVLRKSLARILLSSKDAFIGGQAVIEGVVIRSKERIAIAVRGKDGSIKVKSWGVKPYTSINPILGFPIIRGLVALYDAIYWGIKGLFYSANEALDDSEKISLKEVVGGVVLAFALAIGLFVILPALLAHLLEVNMELGKLSLNLIEGGFRVLTFIAYLLIISFSKEVRRIFSYHGAEHKTINAYEALRSEITPEVVQSYSRFHYRCGTSFMLLVLIISIACFTLFERENVIGRLFMRLALIPLIAGISYEVLRLSFSFKIIRFLALPGLWLQYLTTREPMIEQIEVGIAALKGALGDVGEVKEA